MNDNEEKKSTSTNKKLENEFENNTLNAFIANYGGACIGALIALILCFTQLYRLLVCIVIILAGVFLGNYVQKNKSNVKEKLKEFIDKF